jgi:hypothetical protein
LPRGDDLAHVAFGRSGESVASSFKRSDREAERMTVLIVTAVLFAALVFVIVQRRRSEKAEFDERSDVTKMVVAANRRRKDAKAAVRLMREK